MKNLSNILCLIMSFFISFSFAQEAVTIPGTQVHHIQSDIIKGQDYKLLVHFPGNINEMEGPIPVLYLLDAQWDFPLMTSIYWQQYYDGFVPEMIIVGITWGSEGDDPNVLRRRDFIPTIDASNSVGGGADVFLDVFEQEIFPYVEKNFEGDPNDRTLCGSSFGGLFTLHALFNRSDLFKRYFLTSPAISWDDYDLYNSEKKYAEGEHTDEKYLFLAHGEKEGGVDDFNLFVDKLKSRNYSHLNIKHAILEDVGHAGTKASGYTWGVQHVFDRGEISLPDNQIEQYVGLYKSEDGQTFNIVNKQGRLYQRSQRRSIPLQIIAKDELKHAGHFFKMKMYFDAHSLVSGMDVMTYGNTTYFGKVRQ